MTIYWKRSLALSGLAFCAWLLGSGCTTPEMKGTPFYSGEYAGRRGPAEQRINAWPLCYYREPAISVLWPILEFTDDHTAVRPFYSVYGLDRAEREYNVLWPLAQFDRKSDDNRVFPVFWGEDYRVLFPFYWHFGELRGPGGGSDSLFPLWVVGNETTNDFSGWLTWPLVTGGTTHAITAKAAWFCRCIGSRKTGKARCFFRHCG